MKKLLIVLLVIFVSAGRDTEKKCTIKGLLIPKEKDTTFFGQIIKEESNYMLLFKASKFPTYEARIPIKENKFIYKFNFKDPEVFELIREKEFKQGAMNVTSFFCEDGQIDLTIYPDNNRITVIKGYTLNEELNNYYINLQRLFWNEYQKYNDSIDILSKKGTIVFSKEFSELNEKRKKATDEKILRQIDNELEYLQNTGLMYTPEARKFVKIQDSIFNEKKKWEFDNIYKNTTLLSYYLFMNNIKETAKSCCWKEVDADLINNAKNNLVKYVTKFPDHPYGIVINNILSGLMNIHDGGRFIDFTGPDINGQHHSFSKIFKSNKIILLDFWSTWCAPCVETSRNLIPIYNEYAKKGFEIIGITQCDSKLNNIESFIRKEQYPWNNLIDYDGKKGIWDKYNLSNQGGGLFLVNASGRIIAVNPTVEDIKKKLFEELR